MTRSKSLVASYGYETSIPLLLLSILCLLFIEIRSMRNPFFIGWHRADFYKNKLWLFLVVLPCSALKTRYSNR
uniref:Uncharacterized protein n=1 Tax=Manihot esculenta TaxID=3983 RepID=A0A2C9W8Z5_MANES